jgi:hypothetical protein
MKATKTAKRRKTDEVDAATSAGTEAGTDTGDELRDPVLGVQLDCVPMEEVVTLQLPAVRVWAPATVWYWLVLGQARHPVSQQCLKTAEVDAVIRAAVRSCSGSPAGPARFLLCGELDAACPTESSVRARFKDEPPCVPIPCMAAILAEKLESIQDLVLNECSLDAVRNAHQSLQKLSVTWLWLYDSLWGQLVRLDPALAVQCMLTSALPAFREAMNNSFAYHPVALLPVLRHFVFLEEYVCRAALGASDEGAWRYEAIVQPTGSARPIGFAQWPLGSRSAIMPPRPSNPQYIDFCQVQLEAISLVRADQVPNPISMDVGREPRIEEHTFSAQISAQFLHILTHGALQQDILGGRMVVFNPEEELEGETEEFDTEDDSEDM